MREYIYTIHARLCPQRRPGFGQRLPMIPDAKRSSRLIR